MLWFGLRLGSKKSTSSQTQKTPPSVDQAQERERERENDRSMARFKHKPTIQQKALGVRVGAPVGALFGAMLSRSLRIFVGIFCAILISLFWFKLTPQDAETDNRKLSKVPVTAVQVPQGTTLGYETASLKRKNQMSSPLNENENKNPDAPLDLESTNLSEEEISALCWKQVDAKIEANDFVEVNRSYFEQKLGQWYLSLSPQEQASDSGDTSGSWNTANQSAPTSGTSLAGRFLFALGQAGLIEGREVDHDEIEALRSLEEISSADPGNSAPLVFAALIEHRRGNKARALELLRLTEATDRFDTYLSSVARLVFEKIEKPEDLLTATAIWAHAPVPNYLELRAFLRAFPMEKLAAQLISPALREDAIIPDVDWFALEYAVGKSLMSLSGDVSHLPTLSDLRIQKDKLNLLNAETVISRLRETCDLSSLNPIVRSLREQLANRSFGLPNGEI